jgi:uncharacterized protein
MTLFPEAGRSAGAGEGHIELEESDQTLDDGATSTGTYSGDEIDLSELLRESLLLELPMRPLCSDDCVGLCSVCGKNLNQGPCGCVHDDVDPRWAVLKDLKVS